MCDWGRGSFAAPAASDFSRGGKVTKRPFKGEMFRLISPLKIPLSATKKRVVTPFFDFSPRGEKNLDIFSWRKLSVVGVPHLKAFSSLETAPVTLSRLRGAFFFRRRVKLGHRSNLCRCR